MYLECQECHTRKTIRKRFVIMYLFIVIAMLCLYAYMVDYFESAMANALLVIVFFVSIVAVPFGGEMVAWIDKRKVCKVCGSFNWKLEH